jgi:hypothetical protein
MLKTNAGAQRYLSPWNIEELRVGLPRMQQDIKLDDALARIKDVGLLPRYLLDDVLFAERVELLNVAVSSLSNDRQKLKDIIEFRGTVSKGTTIAGTIFAVFAEVQKLNDSAQDGRLHGCGYDGQTGVVYTGKTLDFMSEKVVNEIVKANRESILSFSAIVDSGMRSSMGQIVEDLFWTDLSNADKGTLKMKQWELVDGTKSAEKSTDFVLSTPLTLHSDHKLGDVNSIVDRRGKVARMEVRCALIDFGGPGRKVYQVTISDDHDLKAGPMVKLLVNLGYLIKDDNGLLQVNTMATPEDSLDFYWVVPYGRESVWKKKKPKTLNAGENITKEELQKCIRIHVKQYVLVMEAEEPFKKD